MSQQETEDTQQVQLPSQLVERVENRVARTEFEDTGEYVAYLVEEVLARVDDSADKAIDDNREELEARLKSLGYLDN